MSVRSTRASSTGGRLSGLRGTRGGGGREGFSGRPLCAGVTRRRLTVMMSHALGGEVALVHALCAILAGSAAVLVDALCLALAAADTGTTGPEGSGANDARRHGAEEESRKDSSIRVDEG